MKQGCTGQGHSIFSNIRWQEVSGKKSGMRENCSGREERFANLDTNAPGQITSVTVL